MAQINTDMALQRRSLLSLMATSFRPKSFRKENLKNEKKRKNYKIGARALVDLEMQRYR